MPRAGLEGCTPCGVYLGTGIPLYMTGFALLVTVVSGIWSCNAQFLLQLRYLEWVPLCDALSHETYML